MNLTHLDEKNNPTMVDISQKLVTERSAIAKCSVWLPREIREMIEGEDLKTKKGPVFHTAIIAATMAVKKTSEIIPFCHPIPLNSIKVNINLSGENATVTCQVKTEGKTGVEMEALHGAQVAALTIYDMCKAISQEMVIRECYLLEKSGGKNDFKKA